MTQREDLQTANTTPGGNSGRRGDPGRLLSTADSPRGELESTVARIFGEVLGVSSLPRMVSFFDLGLNSVAVTVACARLEQATGVRVRFTQLFRTPTVAQLATWIDAARDAGDGVASTGRNAELVALTPMQAHSVPMDIVPRFAWWFDGRVDEGAGQCRDRCAPPPPGAARPVPARAGSRFGRTPGRSRSGAVSAVGGTGGRRRGE